MKKMMIGIKIDLKVIALQYKKLLLFALQMIILCIAIGIAGSQILYAERNVEPFKIAIVDKEDSRWTAMIISAVKEMKTVTQLCKVEVLSQEEAERQLDKEEIAAIVTIPNDFVDSVMSGENKPLTVERKDSTLLEELVADKLILAAAKLLSSAQAGIYSTLDAYEIYGSDGGASFDSLMQEINIIFAKEMLNRHSFFEEKEVVATDMLTPLGHYILSGFIVMMILGLMLIIDVVDVFNQQENIMRYKVAQLKATTLIGQKLMSITLFNLIGGTIILGSVAIFSKVFSLELDWQWSVIAFFNSIVAAIGLAALSILLGLLLKGKEAYSLFLFIITAVMAFLSGGIIPSAYLPDMINGLSYLTYNGYALKLLQSWFGVECQIEMYLDMGILVIICLSISRGILDYSQDNRHNL